MIDRSFRVGAGTVLGGCAVFLLHGCVYSGLLTEELPRSLQTSRESYLVEIHASQPILEVPYHFTNRQGETVFVRVCAGTIAASFERRIEGLSQPTNLTTVSGCEVEVRSVATGEILRDTATVIWRSVGDDDDPRTFRYGAVAGEYRIRLSQAAATPRVAPVPPGGTTVPPELPVSNMFHVVEPPYTPCRGPGITTPCR